MRSLVPFVSEQKTVRGDDVLAQKKRASGKVIDEVIVCETQESSWEDTVPPEAQAAIKNPGAVGVSLPSVEPANKTAPLSKPAFTKPATTKSPAKTAARSPSRTPAAAPSGSPVFYDGPLLEWKLIGDGRGLRVDVLGNIDHHLRPEWRRLLDETEGDDLKVFEFNLNDTPALSLTGLGMLLLFRERKGLNKGKIALCNCNPKVSELLHWSGMERYFTIEDKPQ
jgi:anti-anti-sigma factor